MASLEEEDSLHLLPSAPSCPVSDLLSLQPAVPRQQLAKYVDLARAGRLEKALDASSFFPELVATWLRSFLFAGLPCSTGSGWLACPVPSVGCRAIDGHVHLC